jgi:Holliday junction resolvase RusA-like endonuclease
MAKMRHTITAKLPGYQSARYEWRRKILKNVRAAQADRVVKYDSESRFEVIVLLYLRKGKRHDIHDVDNRLKDILDALQGRFGGSKTTRSKTRLFDNDRQVSRVVIEKQPIPKNLDDDAGGRIMIRAYGPSRWPLQRTKGKSFRKG